MSYFFFKSIDWPAMMKQEVPTPFVPLLNDPTDTSLFEKEFTEQPVHSPITNSDYNESLYEDSATDLFDDFHFSLEEEE